MSQLALHETAGNNSAGTQTEADPFFGPCLLCRAEPQDHAACLGVSGIRYNDLGTC